MTDTFLILYNSGEMSKLRSVFLGAVTCLTLLFSTGCSFPSIGSPNTPSEEFPQEPAAGTPHESVAGVPDRFTAEAEKIAVFANGAPQNFYASDGYSNRGMFDCTWRAYCARVENGVMKMSVSREQNGYAGAEYRSHSFYGHGFYSVRMKAAKCSGVVSSFFTYANHSGWDEIDIEFLGKDTTHVQLNYYSKGVGGHEFWYDLGFDGADDFHEYAFEWVEDSITWYVDGKAVYRATKDIPTSHTQIMMNVWNGKGVDEWSGKFDASALPVTAEYEWIGFSATN